MPVEVVDESGSEAGAALLEAAEAAGAEVLACIGRADEELCVLFVDDGRMRELNRTWRGKDAPTDVLSFSQLEGQQGDEAGAATPPMPAAMLGDVVISIDTLQRQAREGGWTDAEEVARLVLHGVLHLAGYDHERADEAEAMRREEERIVRALEARGIRVAWEEPTS